ncbi:hypothetical protein ABZP36_003311 [Zizania latifolia]
MGDSLFNRLMDTCSPKQRPGFMSRQKRASLWAQREPIPVNQPNAGSVQGRKEKKRIKQRKAFIMDFVFF